MNLPVLIGIAGIAYVGLFALLFGRIARYIGLVFLVLALGTLGVIVWRSQRCASEFDRIDLGVTAVEVERRLGTPSQVTDCSTTFGGYERGDGEQAKSGYTKELWYYAIWAPEGWSFTFDNQSRLIDKYHWVSP